MFPVCLYPYVYTYRTPPYFPLLRERFICIPYIAGVEEATLATGGAAVTATRRPTLPVFPAASVAE